MVLLTSGADVHGSEGSRDSRVLIFQAIGYEFQGYKFFHSTNNKIEDKFRLLKFASSWQSASELIKRP